MKKFRQFTAIFLVLTLLMGCGAPAKTAPAETAAAAAAETTAAAETKAAVEVPKVTAAAEGNPKVTAAVETAAAEESSEAAEKETEAAAESSEASEKETEAAEETEAEAESEAAETAETAEPETSSEEETKADDETVEIRFSPDMAAAFEMSEDSFADPESGVERVVKNEDGSLSIFMTKESHTKTMEELKTEIDKALLDLCDETIGITEVTANGDYTSFIVKTKNGEMTFYESLSSMLLYMYGGLYNLMNGGSLENIHIDFVNAETGKVLESADSGNVEEYMRSLTDLGSLFGTEGFDTGSEGSDTGSDTGTEGEGTTAPELKDIEVLEEYALRDPDSSYIWHFYLVRNNGTAAADIAANTVAYDADGRVIGAADGALSCLPAGCTGLFYEVFDADGEAAAFDPQFFVTAPFGEPVMQNLEVHEDVLTRGVVVHVTNNGEKKAESVQITALFFKDGELVDYGEAWFSDSEGNLAPGKTMSKQIGTEQEFDSVKVYLAGGQYYGW